MSKAGPHYFNVAKYLPKTEFVYILQRRPGILSVRKLPIAGLRRFPSPAFCVHSLPHGGCEDDPKQDLGNLITHK